MEADLDFGIGQVVIDNSNFHAYYSTACIQQSKIPNNGNEDIDQSCNRLYIYDPPYEMPLSKKWTQMWSLATSETYQRTMMETGWDFYWKRNNKYIV